MKYSVLDKIVDSDGETIDQGIIDIDMDLRDAVEALFATRTNEVDGIELIAPSCSDYTQARWISVHNFGEYRTGARESRSLHIPCGVTSASRARLIRLLMA